MLGTARARREMNSAMPPTMMSTTAATHTTKRQVRFEQEAALGGEIVSRCGLGERYCFLCIQFV